MAEEQTRQMSESEYILTKMNKKLSTQLGELHVANAELATLLEMAEQKNKWYEEKAKKQAENLTKSPDPKE